MNAPTDGLDAPVLYDFEEVQARWQGQWDNELRFDSSDRTGPADPTYYVLQSPPFPREDRPLRQLKSTSFAGALTRYHRLRGRRVLTEYPDRAWGDVQVPDWPEQVKRLRRMLGACEGVELIIGATEIDQARVLTKTLARMNLTAKQPHIRGLALGLVTGDDHTPMSSTKPYVERYGADTVGCYVIFMGPHDHDLAWSHGQIRGVHRFLTRLWRLAHDLPPRLDSPPRPPGDADLELLRKAHQTIDHVTEIIQTDERFHVAIATVMQLVSESIRARDLLQPATVRFATETAALLLFPFAPYCAADVYHQLTGEHVWQKPWPTADSAYLTADEREIAVLVDGKVRDRVYVKCDISRDELTRLARRSSHAQEHIRGHEISREVVVPGKLVNFVTR